MSKPNNYNGGPEVIATPRTLEEFWGYFAIREEEDPELYAGYSDLAADIVDSIEMVKSRDINGEPLSIDLALIPGRSNGIYTDEQTIPSRELLELIYAVNNVLPVADETTTKNPYGRVLWASREPDGVQIIESLTAGDDGDIMRLTAISDAPWDLLYARPAQTVYSKETDRAIKTSRIIQQLASRSISEARDSELAYFEFVQTLPVTDFESPHDTAT